MNLMLTTATCWVGTAHALHVCSVQCRELFSRQACSGSCGGIWKRTVHYKMMHWAFMLPHPASEIQRWHKAGTPTTCAHGLQTHNMQYMQKLRKSRCNPHTVNRVAWVLPTPPGMPGELVKRSKDRAKMKTAGSRQETHEILS